MSKIMEIHERYLPEIAVIYNAVFIVLGVVSPNDFTEEYLITLGLLGAAFAVKVRIDVGYNR